MPVSPYKPFVSCVSGTWPCLALGLSGIIEGNLVQLGRQAVSLLAAAYYSLVVIFGIAKLIDATMGLRASAEDEELGLDLSQHGERGYIMDIDELAHPHTRAGLAASAHPAASAEASGESFAETTAQAGIDTVGVA